jgi:hypothetical protein
VFDQRLLGAIRHGRNPQGTLLCRPGFGNVHPTAWRRAAREVQGVYPVQPLLGRQIGDPIDPWCLLPLVILRDVPYR